MELNQPQIKCRRQAERIIISKSGMETFPRFYDAQLARSSFSLSLQFMQLHNEEHHFCFNQIFYAPPLVHLSPLTAVEVRDFALNAPPC